MVLQRFRFEMWRVGGKKTGHRPFFLFQPPASLLLEKSLPTAIAGEARRKVPTITTEGNWALDLLTIRFFGGGFMELWSHSQEEEERNLWEFSISSTLENHPCCRVISMSVDLPRNASGMLDKQSIALAALGSARAFLNVNPYSWSFWCVRGAIPQPHKNPVLSARVFLARVT